MAFYAGQDRRAPGDGEPDAGCPDRPQRPRRPALRHVRLCQELLRQTPVQAEDREHLRKLLDRRLRRRGVHDHPEILAGGRARRYPVLSDRRNIVVIADEAHRSQYDFIARSTQDGDRLRLRQAPARRAAECLVHRLHRHADREGRRQHAGRVRRLHRHLRHPAGRRGQGDRADLLREPARQAGTDEDERPKIDAEFEEIDRRRGAETSKEKLKTQVGALEALVGADKRIDARRRRPGEALRGAPRGDGRQGDDRLHEPPHLRRRSTTPSSKLRPDWHSDEDDDKGVIKIVMTGSPTDPLDWQPHIRNKPKPRATWPSGSRTRTTRSSSSSCATCG